MAAARGLPPGPRWPLALQTLRYGVDPYGLFESAQRAFGDVFTLRVMGETWVILAHPDAVRELYGYRPDEVDSGVANLALRPLLGTRSVLLLDGAEHLRRRKLVLPPFHGERMRAYEDLIRAATRERDLGLQTIQLDPIVGTVDRQRGEFDRLFRPASRRVRHRWQSVAAARRRGKSMPPIDVYRIGELHFVQDGHHRVSVAHAHGDTTIEAQVREVQTTRAATHGLLLRELQLIRHQREFHERVLPAPARARIQIAEGWRYDQLSTHVESWAYRASHADGRLLSRAPAAEAWFREEYEPIADVLDELGIGGPGTETTRYLRIVKLRNLLMHDRGWTDDVIEVLLEAIRNSAPDEVDEVVHRILKEMR